MKKQMYTLRRSGEEDVLVERNDIKEMLIEGSLYSLDKVFVEETNSWCSVQEFVDSKSNVTNIQCADKECSDEKYILRREDKDISTTKDSLIEMNQNGMIKQDDKIWSDKQQKWSDAKEYDFLRFKHNGEPVLEQKNNVSCDVAGACEGPFKIVEGAVPPVESSCQGTSLGTQYRGVGGWLMLLCLGMVILTPLRTIYALIMGYNELIPYFGVIVGVVDMLILQILISVGVMSLGICAGIMLFSVKPKAVTWAKAYLISLLVSDLVSYIVLNIPQVSQEVRQLMMQEGLKQSVITVIYVAIWYSYLCKSKRVKATYN